MRNNFKIKIVLSQVFIVIAFFGGMLLNYFLLTPIIDEGEGARIRREIVRYMRKFDPERGINARDSATIAAIASDNEAPYGGEFIVLDDGGKTIYCSWGETGEPFGILKRKYGETACAHLRNVMSDPSAQLMIYDKGNHFSYYAYRNSNFGVSCLYAVDYQISGSKTIRTFRFLEFFMLIVGVLLISLCAVNMRRLIQKATNESSLEKELQTAAAIQKSMIPRGVRHLMQVDLDARLLPAKKVGGDFYCYKTLDGFLYFCIGDVSGKGVPASLCMSKAVTLFRGCANAGLKPSAIAENMNEELCAGNDQNIFVTAFIGRMNLTDGTTEFVNAGHELPVIWNGCSDSRPSFLQGPKNIPLGVIASDGFEQGATVLEKNGMMLLYTDGISEARSSRSTLLGRGKMLEIVDGFKERNSKEINDCLLEKVNAFERGTDQSDDITLLTFRNIVSPKQLRIKNDIKELRKIREFTDEVFKECPIDDKQKVRIRSGLDEALTNCVKYAYEDGDGTVEVSSTLENGDLVFTLKDSGKEFNPLEYESPETNGELRIGGLGIMMMKASFDSLEYERKDGTNILRMIKKIR